MRGFIEVALLHEDDNTVQEALLNVAHIKGVFREGVNGASLWVHNVDYEGESEDVRFMVDDTYDVVLGKIRAAMY